MRWWVKLSSSLKRLHVSREPIVDLKSHYGQGKDYKPKGLWYACGTEWLDFVNREFRSGKGDYLYEITINPSRILFIADAFAFIWNSIDRLEQSVRTIRRHRNMSL
jgi:hypothetical protein